MKASLKENLEISVAALGSIVVLFGIFASLEWLGLDWRKWGGFVVFTAATFGYLLNRYYSDMRRTRCLVILISIFIAHTLVSVLALRTVSSFPILYYIFLTPLEAGVAGFLLVAFGGARAAARRRN